MCYNAGMTVAERLTQAELSSLGGRLHALRLGREWTLDELARRAGLSKSYLSRLEDGERQPSIAALLSLAQAHGLPLASLFGASEDSPRRCAVVRVGEAPSRQGNGLAYSPMSDAGRNAQMQPIRVTVPAGRVGDEMYQHDGEEWLFVLSGTLRLALGDEAHTLQPGDAAHFDARIPHRLSALDGHDAELILVACAGPRMLLDSYLTTNFQR